NNPSTLSNISLNPSLSNISSNPSISSNPNISSNSTNISSNNTTLIDSNTLSSIDLDKIKNSIHQSPFCNIDKILHSIRINKHVQSFIDSFTYEEQCFNFALTQDEMKLLQQGKSYVHVQLYDFELKPE